MKPFLYTLAEAFYTEHSDNLSHIAFIFPNRRAGIFFQKYLAEVAGHPIFSPPILTVSDFYTSLTTYRMADRITLLCMLYRRYVQLMDTDESFDEFLFWGEMLLNDFDDIDKYVVDAQQLFTNIEDIKDIEDTFSYLSEEQQAAIRRFWTNFNPAVTSEKKEQFMSVWSILYTLYSELRGELSEQGLAYEGMIFRDVADRCKELVLPYQQVVFVGLNVLTESEKRVMKHLANIGVADFYWDYQSPMLQDEYNKAAYFMRENILLFPSRIKLQLESHPTPQFELIGVPSAVGQTKQAYTILSKLLDAGAIPNPKAAINTAIVLPDEQLLTPMLHAIPASIDPINVTMGYTLKQTAIAGLMDSIFDLQRYIRMVQGTPHFYHRKVLSLLTHRYILSAGEGEARTLVEEIRRYNKVYMPTQELHRNPLLEALFQPLHTADEAASYLLRLLELLHEGIPTVADDLPDTAEEETQQSVEVLAVEKEFIYHYYITVKRLQDVLQRFDLQMNVTTLFKLINKLTSSIAIPFTGEPLSGLQVMGVLETRALDFENLVILSVNEGVFPVRKVANTFIPYNLRKGFGLSTTDHQDSIYAYYFYRMIYRAKRVFLLYDTRAEGLQSGEVSRYLYQLKHHYRVPIEHKFVTATIEEKSTPPISIAKTPAVMQGLQQFMEGGERALSASAINTYINCPLQFYLQYVERFEEVKEVNETVEPSIFGSIYHSVMESIYNPCMSEEITPQLLKVIGKNSALITQYIEEAFAVHFFKNKKRKELTGQNLLVGEVIRKYVAKTLEVDALHAPFQYVESERRIELAYPIDAGRKVNLKAFVDRIDQKEGTIRIVDYKTGGGKDSFKQIADLFDSELLDKRPKAVMQVFMYALMYKLDKGVTAPIEPAIYYLRTLFGSFNPAISQEIGRGKRDKVTDYGIFDTEFREAFTQLLQQIFDPNSSFEQSPDVKSCQYCPFTNLCKRG